MQDNGNEKKGFFKGLKDKLFKSRNNIFRKLSEIVGLRKTIDEGLLDEIEEILIQSDIGVNLSMEIIDQLKDDVAEHKLKETKDIIHRLSENLINLVDSDKDVNILEKSYDARPAVFLITGVNGVGKTTTIAKLAHLMNKKKKKILLVAADTFRAAAEEQLAIWAKRVNVELFQLEKNSNPSAVIYDALVYAKKNDFENVIIDTAGRLHTKVNLMRELEKIDRVIKKVIPDAPHESFLVLDATTGQNAMSQVDLFNKSIKLTGMILTKLDGTAKGGVVLQIKDKYDIPIAFIGVGEKMEDLKVFDSKEFVYALFDE